MKIHKTIYTLGFVVFVALLYLGVSPIVHAEEGQSQSNTTTETRSRADLETKREEAQKQFEANREARSSAVKDRLTDARLRACQARQTMIKAIMKRAAQRGQHHITLFSTIAQRVETFYVKKGKTLTNYDQLVADVSAKKAAAEAAVRAVSENGEAFTCSADNPKGNIEEFKAKLRAQEEAIKTFRTSVKNLIVGVKSVQSVEARAGGETR